MTFEEKLWFLREFAQKNRVPILTQKKAQWLETFIRQENPQSILEIGCAIGYSTSILGHQGANVVAVDMSEPALQHAKEFTSYFDQSITFVHSEGLEYMQSCTQKFDCIFIDFQKSYYEQAAELVKNHLHEEGSVLFDNVTHSKIPHFVSHMMNNKNWECTHIDIDDGFLLCKLKS
ncbi:MAG: O-methyltransferase [Candidatus Woesearchaeota archaeon]